MELFQTIVSLPTYYCSRHLNARSTILTLSPTLNRTLTLTLTLTFNPGPNPDPSTLTDQRRSIISTAQTIHDVQSANNIQRCGIRAAWWMG